MNDPHVSDVEVRQGDRRRTTVRILAWSLPALAVIGLVLYAYWYPFDVP